MFSVTVIGSTENLLLTGAVSLSEGRFMTTAEAEGGRPVCVIGSEVATNLFDRETPLGKQSFARPCQVPLVPGTPSGAVSAAALPRAQIAKS